MVQHNISKGGLEIWKLKFKLLQHFYLEELNVRTLDWSQQSKFRSLLNFSWAENRNDQLIITFIGTLLSQCTAVENLYLEVYDPVTLILKSLSHLKHRLKLIKLTDPENWGALEINTAEVVQTITGKTVVIDGLALAHAQNLLNFSTEAVSMVVLADIPDQRGGREPIDLSLLMHPNLRQLHVIGRLSYSVIQRRCAMLNDLSRCYYLTHLCFTMVRIELSVGSKLAKAVQTGNLPKLSHMSLKGCSFKDEHPLFVLFEPTWQSLTHLDLREICIPDGQPAHKLEVFFETHQATFPRLHSLYMCTETLNPYTMPNRYSLTSIWLYNLNPVIDRSHSDLMNILNVETFGICMRKSFNLRRCPPSCVEMAHKMTEKDSRAYKTTASFVYHFNVEWVDDFLRYLRVESPRLKQMSMHGAICSAIQLYAMTKSSRLPHLVKLDISHSVGIGGVLSLLLCHKFYSLETLGLRNCGLLAEDLRSVAKSNVADRLPKLEHIDLSENAFGSSAEEMFSFGCQWNSLLSLNVQKNSPDLFNVLSSRVQSGCLSSLKHLGISVDLSRSYDCGCTWASLTDLNIQSDSVRENDVGLYSTLAKLLKENLFPSLENIYLRRKLRDKRLHAIVDEWCNALTPEARELHGSWPDSATIQVRVLLHVREHGASSLRAAAKREATALVESDTEGRYIADKPRFAEAYTEYLIYTHSQKLSLVTLLEHDGDEILGMDSSESVLILFKYNFYDHFDSIRDNALCESCFDLV